MKVMLTTSEEVALQLLEANVPYLTREFLMAIIYPDVHSAHLEIGNKTEWGGGGVEVGWNG